jgi:Methylamine utilisation protein MauE
VNHILDYVLMYLLAYCRLLVGILFAVSFAGKALNISTFEQTITSFRLLPKRMIRATALTLLAAELLVVALVAIGGRYLNFGLALAILLLVIFSGVLVSVMVRGILTSCNCFGPTDKPVSWYDVWRNVALLGCALLGLGILSTSGAEQRVLGFVEWFIVGLAMAISVALWASLGHIVKLFRRL